MVFPSQETLIGLGLPQQRIDQTQQQIGQRQQVLDAAQSERVMGFLGNAATALKAEQDPIRRAGLWNQTKALGQGLGVDLQQFDQQVLGPNANQLFDSVIAQTAKRAAPPAGFRRTAAGLEAVPGGPKDIDVLRQQAVAGRRTAEEEAEIRRASRAPVRTLEEEKALAAAKRKPDKTLAQIEKEAAAGAKGRASVAGGGRGFVTAVDAQGRSLGTFRKDDPRINEFLATPGVRVITSPRVTVGRTKQDIAIQQRASSFNALKRLYDITGTPVPGNADTADKFVAAGGSIPEKKEMAALQATAAGLKNFENSVARVDKILAKNPTASTWGGVLAKTANKAVANVRGVAEAAGLLAIDQSEEVAGHADVWRDAEINSTAARLGIDASVLKSLVVDMAYMGAVARGQTGRGLSDRDVRNFAEIIGATERNPASISAVLDSFTDRFRDSLRNGLQVRAGAGQQEQAAEPDAGQVLARPQTQSDFDALPPGSRYIDPDSNETREKR